MAAQRDVPAEVRRILAEQLDIDAKDIRPESKLIDDLGADSLALVELLLCFEESFDLDVPDEDVEKIVTVQEVIDYLQKSLLPQET